MGCIFFHLLAGLLSIFGLFQHLSWSRLDHLVLERKGGLNANEQKKWLQTMKRSRNTSQPSWVHRYGGWGDARRRVDGWMDGWKDVGERLNGSTWQLIERGSRVASLCNLLAGPWCMQAWYQQAWQTHTRLREQWGETSLCFHRLRCKKKKKKRQEAVCFHPLLSRRDQLLFQFFALHKQQISIRHTSWRNHPFPVIPTAFCWSDVRSSHTFTRSHHKFRRGSGNSNAALRWDFFVVPFCMWQSTSGLLTWDWSRRPWQLSAVITRDPHQTHKYTNIHISPD